MTQLAPKPHSCLLSDARKAIPRQLVSHTTGKDAEAALPSTALGYKGLAAMLMLERG